MMMMIIMWLMKFMMNTKCIEKIIDKLMKPVLITTYAQSIADISVKYLYIFEMKGHIVSDIINKVGANIKIRNK